MNLFALTDNPSARILKFSITGQLQNEISLHFQDARSDFNRDITENIPFDGKYSPESNELLVIPDFEDIDSIGDAVQNPRAVDDLVPSDVVFDSIKAIFAGETSPSGKPEILIQKFDRKKVISTSGLSLYYSNDTYKKVDGKGLTLDPRLTAILYDGSLTGC